VDVLDPPYECYFIKRRLNTKKFTLREELAVPMTYLRATLRCFMRHASYVLTDNLEELRSMLDDGITFTADDMSNSLLGAADAAATVASAFRRVLIQEPSFNRWMSMMLETYYKMDAGLTSLGTSVAVEVDGEWRLCDNRTIVWLVGVLLRGIEVNVINQESYVSRWQENVNLWTTRNFNDPNYYLGVLE
jgi:hypothetical protein